MSQRDIVKDSTNKSVVIRIIDSATGLPEEAVEHDTAGIAMWYRREGATKQTVATAALANLASDHADGGIEHIDDGYYRFDLPNAAFATAVDGVMIGGTVTGMIVIGAYIDLITAPATAANVTSAHSTTDGLITALNNVSATEIDNPIKADTYSLPGQGAPTLTPTLEEAIMYLYKQFRNKETQTATQGKLYANDGTTVDQLSTVSDDGTTFTKGKVGTGA